METNAGHESAGGFRTFAEGILRWAPVFQLVGLGLTLAGLVFASETIRSSFYNSRHRTNDSLTRLNQEVLKLQFEHPEIRRYFHGAQAVGLEDAPQHGGDPELMSRVLTLCEMYADLFDVVADNRYPLGEDEYAGWKTYALAIWHQSPELRKFVGDRLDWYGDRLMEMLDQPNGSPRSAGSRKDGGRNVVP